MKHLFILSLATILFACQKPTDDIRPIPTMYMSNQMPCTYGGDTIQSNPDIPLPIGQWIDTADILVIEGQSNVGRIWWEEFGLPRLTMNKPQDTTFIMSYPGTKGQWMIMDIAKYATDLVSNGKCGFQPIIAWEYMRRYKDDFYIYQASKGGKPIEDFTTPGKEMYAYIDTTLKKMINNFIEKGIYPNIIGTIWYQGETNGGANPVSYSDQLTQVYNLNCQWTGQKAPFIVVQMDDSQYKVPYLSQLQSTQYNWVQSHNNTFLVPKTEGSTTTDGYHITYPAMKQKGDFINNILFNN